MSKKDELIFVYNADSGRWNTYMDILHKVFSPMTYPCSLCAITHRAFAIENQWKDFIDNSGIPMQFLHRNEWKNEYDVSSQLPAVFRKKGTELVVFLDSKMLNQLELKELQEYITEHY